MLFGCKGIVLIKDINDYDSVILEINPWFKLKFIKLEVSLITTSITETKVYLKTYSTHQSWKLKTFMKPRTILSFI